MASTDEASYFLSFSARLIALQLRLSPANKSLFGGTFESSGEPIDFVAGHLNFAEWILVRIQL